MWEKLGNDRAFFGSTKIKNFELERDLSRVFSPLKHPCFLYNRKFRLLLEQ